MGNVCDSLTQIHYAQVAILQENIPNVQSVHPYTPDEVDARTVIETPAICLEAVQIDLSETISGGRFPLSVEFAAHCLLSRQTKQVELEIRNFAARVAQVVHRNRWKLDNANHPHGVTAYPSVVRGHHGFESWTVFWQQTFHLGDISL